MNPRKLALPSLISLLIDEYKKSKEKILRIEELIMRGGYTKTRELVDELKSDLEQHIIDEEA